MIYLMEENCREISGKPVSIIFDGTSRLGEALVIVLRFLNNWEIKQRLVQLVRSMSWLERRSWLEKSLASIVESTIYPQNRCWQQ